MIDESILHAMTGAIGIDVILALLICSLAPAQPSDTSHASRSPLRLISMAYQMGCSMALEVEARAILRMGDALKEPWWKERLGRVMLVCPRRYEVPLTDSGRPSRIDTTCEGPDKET